MTYFEKLHPWCIIRPLPNLQRRIIARCRRRNLKTLAVVWSAIKREAERYTEEALLRLSQLHEQRQAQLSCP
jgi:hypothetical protein